MIILNIDFKSSVLYQDYEINTKKTTNITVNFEIDSFKGSLTFLYDNISDLTLKELHDFIEEEAIRKMKLQVERMETK